MATVRGSYNNSTEQNRGVGGFVLPEAGVNAQNREDELYYNDSLVISRRLLNQFRVVFGRDHAPTVSTSQAPALVVPGAFTGGGAQCDRLQTENHMNLNEIVTWTPKKHSVRFGINVPDISRRGMSDHTNTGGTYYFSTRAGLRVPTPVFIHSAAGRRAHRFPRNSRGRLRSGRLSAATERHAIGGPALRLAELLTG